MGPVIMQIVLGINHRNAVHACSWEEFFSTHSLYTFLRTSDVLLCFVFLQKNHVYEKTLVREQHSVLARKQSLRSVRLLCEIEELSPGKMNTGNVADTNLLTRGRDQNRRPLVPSATRDHVQKTQKTEMPVQPALPGQLGCTKYPHRQTYYLYLQTAP